jgi:hypothetical protein
MKGTSGLAALVLACALHIPAPPAAGRTEEAAPPRAPDEEVQRAAMSKLDFMLGQWIGQGWSEPAPNQRATGSVTELYAFRGNGLILDGEGFFRMHSEDGAAVVPTDYGLGMLFFDTQNHEYRMWHCCSQGQAMTVKLDMDLEARSGRYTAKDANGRPYRFGFKLSADGLWTATHERQQPDGSWYTDGQFQMRKVK